jgi:hypothetical protein
MIGNTSRSQHICSNDEFCALAPPWAWLNKYKNNNILTLKNINA